MGTRTGQYIADQAWITAQDVKGTKGVRWPDAEVLMYINDGQVEAVNQVPSANPVRVVVTPAPGAVQNLVDLNLPRGVGVVDVPRNIRANGSTGRAITLQPRRMFDDQDPDWYSETGEQAACWCYDPREPKTFLIRPGIVGGGKLEIVYAAIPQDLNSLDDAISIDDVYANALGSYVLFRFFSKTADYTVDSPRAAAYYQLFLQQLKGKTDATVASAMQAVAQASAGHPRMGGA